MVIAPDGQQLIPYNLGNVVRVIPELVLLGLEIADLEFTTDLVHWQSFAGPPGTRLADGFIDLSSGSSQHTYYRLRLQEYDSTPQNLSAPEQLLGP